MPRLRACRQTCPISFFQPFLARQRRPATRGPAARVALRAARAGLGPGFPFGFACGARRRFASPLVRAVDGAVPATIIRRPSMTNIVLLVGNLGADPQSSHHQRRHRRHHLQPRHQPAQARQRGQDLQGCERLHRQGYRVAPGHLLQRPRPGDRPARRARACSSRFAAGIHNSKWTDSEGIERYGYEIIADDVQFLEPSAPGTEASGEPARTRRRRALLRRPTGPGGFGRRGFFLVLLRRAAVGEGVRLEEAQCGGRRSGSQGCAVPPICFANRLPHAPLRGAFGVPDSRSAARA